MAFIEAMNATIQSITMRVTGVNGEEVLTEAGVGDVRVSLFTMLTRGLSASYIRDQIASASAEHLEDLCVMAMQTRDIRGGKGERDLFFAMLEALWARDPTAVKALVPLIPEYGCWRDMWELWTRLPDLQPVISRTVQAQWLEDTLRTDKRSLLAKWLPRQSSKRYGAIAPYMAHALYPFVPARKRMEVYRKAVADMNRMLGTVEIKMCADRWGEIEPAKVPGRCFHVKKAALLNQKLQKVHGSKKRKATDEERVRSDDRRLCALQVRDFLEKALAGKAVIKGADVVQPHELVREASLSDNNVVEAQWLAVRESAAAAGGFGKAVAMCDFSGSMSGVPLYVSLALGILISETNHPAFRDGILTFDSNPQWHSFAGKKTLRDKVRSVLNVCGQGLSTDFYKACMLLLDRMRAAKVPVGEEPEDLIVLTDMGWDAAHAAPNSYGGSGYSQNRDPWKSQVQKIRDAFAVGGWRMPRIVIWNLRAAYKEFHASAADDGVVMVSGWSPAVLTALQKDGIQTRTPLEGVRAVLDAPRYDKVRAALGLKAVHEE